MEDDQELLETLSVLILIYETSPDTGCPKSKRLLGNRLQKDPQVSFTIKGGIKSCVKRYSVELL